MHKFGSHVCEMAIKCADARSRSCLISEFIVQGQDGWERLILAMRNEFASEFTSALYKQEKSDCVRLRSADSALPGG